jgi:very-short-patch-repair endonuclease
MSQTIKPPMPSRSLEQARDLRGDATDAERKMWRHLRASQVEGMKFRRQHPIPPYVVDFYCERLTLAVELDDSQHEDASDAVRTRFLEARGLTVLRFWNNDVLTNTGAVVESIWNSARNRTLTPTPLPTGEGL